MRQFHHQRKWPCTVFRGHRKLDGQQASQKITKRHFFQDNQVSFLWVTGIGLKTTQPWLAG